MMADGYNHARAMRVAEIISDFRNLQHYMAQIQANPSAEEYYLPGYSLLRACITEAQAVLASPYVYGGNADPEGDLEAEKAQLRAIIIDAGVRRFQLQRCYLRAVAALRWINGRAQILQGQQPHSGHTAQLQQVDATLQQVSKPLNCLSSGVWMVTESQHERAPWLPINTLLCLNLVDFDSRKRDRLDPLNARVNSLSFSPLNGPTVVGSS
ncbi:uncharacterized protein PV09_00681 [Verruconis gallopava]|uniref:Uncharacterized protein n=1 Tax=Verruconis gallopava TaxID=253628 RepID=A0A0D1Z702_9PEZI|nr:uncharacterized protein PV09_00681 [Verruconis gallopava]KIW08742.1 hypothetical protein PV09_00681 [Verruconis gallopava]